MGASAWAAECRAGPSSSASGDRRGVESDCFNASLHWQTSLLTTTVTFALPVPLQCFAFRAFIATTDKSFRSMHTTLCFTPWDVACGGHNYHWPWAMPVAVGLRVGSLTQPSLGGVPVAVVCSATLSGKTFAPSGFQFHSVHTATGSESQA